MLTMNSAVWADKCKTFLHFDLIMEQGKSKSKYLHQPNENISISKLAPVAKPALLQHENKFQPRYLWFCDYLI